MTTIALNYSKSLLEGLWTGLKNTLQGIMVGYILARQAAANQHVAQQLINCGEYRQEDYHNLLAELNRKAIQSIGKEFSRD
jgi:hypothetical protein